MKKLLFIILSLITLSVFATGPTQHVNQITDSTNYNNGVSFQTNLTLIPNAGSGKVLTSDAFGHATWQAGGGGSGWSLTGNTGTNPATNFIGTTDTTQVQIYSNGNDVLAGNSAVNSVLTLLTPTIWASENEYQYMDLATNDSFLNIAGGVFFGAGTGLSIQGSTFSRDSVSYIDLWTDSINFSFHTSAGRFNFYGQVRLDDGTQGNGKVLTSDASGNASWQNPSPGVVISAFDSAQTSTVASVITYTPTTSGTYRIGGFDVVTAVSAGILTVGIAYTDNHGNAQTGTLNTATTLGDNSFAVQDIRIAGSTPITISAILSGGTMTYDIGASLQYMGY